MVTTIFYGLNVYETLNNTISPRRYTNLVLIKKEKNTSLVLILFVT